MTVEVPTPPADTEAEIRAEQPSGLRNLILAGMLVLIALLFIGLPGGPRGGEGNSLPVGPQSNPNVVTVFFSRYQGSEVITEEVVRPIPPEARDDRLGYAIQQLLAGPTPAEKRFGFHTEIPEGTRLLGIAEKDGQVQINLSSEFAQGGGSTAMTQRVAQVRETAYSVDSRSATILVDGQELTTLGGEGLEVPQTMQRQPQ